MPAHLFIVTERRPSTRAAVLPHQLEESNYPSRVRVDNIVPIGIGSWHVLRTRDGGQVERGDDSDTPTTYIVITAITPRY